MLQDRQKGAAHGARHDDQPLHFRMRELPWRADVGMQLQMGDILTKVCMHDTTWCRSVGGRYAERELCSLHCRHNYPRHQHLRLMTALCRFNALAPDSIAWMYLKLSP